MATRKKKLKPKKGIHDKVEIDTTMGQRYLNEGRVRIITRGKI